MKGFVVFLTLAFVAAANAGPARQEKGVIEDALALKKCLEEAVVTIQGDISTVIVTVNKITELIEIYSDKLRACSALAGEDPTVEDQIAVATCLINLADVFKVDIAQTIADVQASIEAVLHAADVIDACF